MAKEMAKTSKTNAKSPVKSSAAGHFHPILSFRREVDHLFDDFFGRTSSLLPQWTLPELNGDLVPEIDIKENKKQMVLTAELPGMNEKDIGISVDDGMLTVKGEKRMEKSEEKEDYRVMERRYGSFQRSFTLPGSIDVDGIKASFDKGVLKVTMPKNAEAKKAAKKVEIS